jgi:hypothetical protein
MARSTLSRHYFWGRALWSAVIFTASLACASCGAPSVLSVLPVRHAPEVAPPISPLTVSLNATSVRLPLVVSGASVAYADVDRALHRSIEVATLTVAHQEIRPPGEPLEPHVELVEARADYSRDRLIVELPVRATLRQRAGNTYVAQTHAHSSASAVVAPERGARAVLTARTRLAISSRPGCSVSKDGGEVCAGSSCLHWYV